MKLTYCIPSLYSPGGMERVLTQKVNYLAATGKYDITLVTIEQEEKPVYFPLHPSIQVVDLGVDFRGHVAAGWFDKWIAHYRQLRLYRKKLEAYLLLHPTDICISLCGKEIEFLSRLKDASVKMAEIHFARDFKTQYLVASHKGKQWEWIGNFLTRRFVKSTRALSRLVVLTKADESVWRKSQQNVVQIYNPVEQKAIGNFPAWQSKWIAVGRLEDQKGFDYLIKAWFYVARIYPEWKLEIWGEGSRRAALEKLIDEWNLQDQVFLRGTTREVEKEYLTSYGSLLSSRYEGFPMTLLEAMSCGIPSVSFDCSHGPAELIREGISGFLVPPGNYQALAQRVCFLIEHPALRERMSEEALALSAKYRPDRIMRQWMDLFDEVIKERDK